MRTILFLAFILALALVMPLNSFSQSGYFSAHIGPAFPLNDFGDDDIDDDDSGLAGMGIDLGGKYVYQLNDDGMGLFAGIDLIYNGLSSSAKDDIEDEMDDYDNLKLYSYINIPVMAGLNYSYKANDEIALFGEFGLGLDFFNMTNMSYEYEYDRHSYDVIYRFDPSTKLAFRIGGGLTFNDDFSLELNYMGLGEQKIDGEVEYDGDTENIPGSEKLKVTIFTLTVAKRF